VKVYHVEVIRDDEWYVGRVMDRPGVTTQGRSLDELVFMLRDAIELMWHERTVHLELAIGSKVRVPSSRARKFGAMGNVVTA
jgi:predicted RNase H-like HicB family nuclease